MKEGRGKEKEKEGKESENRGKKNKRTNLNINGQAMLGLVDLQMPGLTSKVLM